MPRPPRPPERPDGTTAGRATLLAWQVGGDDAGVLALRTDPDQLDGDLVDGPDPSDGVETEAFIQTLVDRRVDALELPAGKDNRGWWADAFFPDEPPVGSRHWLLEDAPLTEATAARAAEYQTEALAPLVADGRISSASPVGAVRGAHVEVSGSVVLPSGAVVELGPQPVN